MSPSPQSVSVVTAELGTVTTFLAVARVIVTVAEEPLAREALGFSTRTVTGYDEVLVVLVAGSRLTLSTVPASAAVSPDPVT